MKQIFWTSLFACAALSLAAAPDPVRQAREQLALVKPEAARRALADLKNNPKYEKAIGKREMDQEFVSEYKVGAYTQYGISGISRK